MILLDTNVLSEMRRIRRGRADPRVAAWAAEQALDRLFVSAVTILELRFGVLSVAPRDPEQARHLDEWLRNGVLSTFAGRILPFDADAALACAALHVPATRSERDAMIAATALVLDLTVATRNTADFAGTGVRLLNPWHA